MRQMFAWALSPEYGYVKRNPARDVTRLRALQHHRQAQACSERRDALKQLYRAVDVLVAAKIGLESSAWRMAVPRHSRRVRAEIDDVVIALREAVSSLHDRPPLPTETDADVGRS